MQKLSNITISKQQSRLIANTIALLAFTIICILLFFACKLFGYFFSTYSIVLMPLIAAIILAMILRPLYEFFYSHAYKNHYFAMILLSIAVFVPIGLLCWFGGRLVINQLTDILFNDNGIMAKIKELPEEIKKYAPPIGALLEKTGIKDYLQNIDQVIADNKETIKSIAGKTFLGIGTTAGFLGGVIYKVVVTFLGWFILPIYIALLLSMRPLGGKDIKEILVFLPEKTRDNIAFLIDQFLGIMVSFFRGQVLVALVQGVCFGIGFQLIGLSYGLIIGLCLGLLNIVPYLGNIMGAIFIIPFIFITGEGFGLLFKALLVFMAVQSLDSYIITPRIMKNRMNLNSLTIIFSLFFWNAVIGGIAGMLLAIPLTAFIVVFWRLLCKEYFTPLKHNVIRTDQ